MCVGKMDNELCTCPVTVYGRKGGSPGPFFHFKDGMPLTRHKFVEKGQFPQWGCHDSSKAGDRRCRKSRAYQVYVKKPRQQLATYSVVIGQGPGPSDIVSLKPHPWIHSTGCITSPAGSGVHAILYLFSFQNLVVPISCFNVILRHYFVVLRKLKMPSFSLQLKA